MRLSDDIRRCVVFLGWQKAGPVDEAPIDPQGTAFLMHGGKELGRGGFLVTAKHIAEEMHPPFVIRVNKKGGGAGLIHIERPQDISWCYHPTDNSVDLAVAPIDAPSWIDAASYGIDDLFAPDPNWATIGAGDPVWVVGLFHFHRGEKSNLPIIHTGHIAMLPGDERIPVRGEMVSAYLVQTNAISGCSGSPVFATRTVIFTLGDQKMVGHFAGATLLGVWSSSWKVKESQIVAIKTDADDPTKIAAPLGMGIVTPAAKLVDIFRGEALMRAREKLSQHKIAARSPTHDSLLPEPPTKADNPQHREDFNRLLDAAVKGQKSDRKT